jgi:hypothetical protein
MHPTPTWAVYRDAKTGLLIRKYISTGDANSSQQTAQSTAGLARTADLKADRR